MINKKSTRISDIVIVVMGVLLTLMGLFLLIFTDAATILNPKINHNLISKVIVKFLGSSYVLSGLLSFLVYKARFKIRILVLTIYHFVGFVNLYLLFDMSGLIYIGNEYYYYQLGLLILLFISLLDELSRKYKN